MTRPRRTVHPIEIRSWRILRSRVDTTGLGYWSRAVVERVIHASADPAYLDDLVLDEDSLTLAAEALARGVNVASDTAMVASGITSVPVLSLTGDPRAARRAREQGTTRAAAAVSLAAQQVEPGAVWAVGNAPTALDAVIDLAEIIRPVLVVGLPVGFVGAAESKARLRASGIPSVSNMSEKGGSPLAAAAVNALLYGDPLVEESAERGRQPG
jgi:precorrin-8X/cobalt-precorrin-8 methylmutase